MEDNKTKIEETQENQEEETKKKTFREWVGDLIAENPGVVIPIVTGFTMLFRGIFGCIMNAGQKDSRYCEVPDDITGLKYRSSHPLTNSEILELSERKQSGESTGEALSGMGLLRKERKRK